MNRAWASMVFSLATGLIHISTAGLAADPSFDRQQDVIYGRKFGTALTMDVFTPKKAAKGVGVILVASAWLQLFTRVDFAALRQAID